MDTLIVMRKPLKDLPGPKKPSRSKGKKQGSGTHANAVLGAAASLETASLTTVAEVDDAFPESVSFVKLYSELCAQGLLKGRGSRTTPWFAKRGRSPLSRQHTNTPTEQTSRESIGDRVPGTELVLEIQYGPTGTDDRLRPQVNSKQP